MSNTIHVVIKDKYKLIFEKDVFSLSSRNSSGDFDVLPDHANFITLIYKYIVVDKGTPNETNIGLEGGGVLTVLSNQVQVYIGI